MSQWPQFNKEQGNIVKKILLSNKINYLNGTEGINFEKEFSKYIGTNYSIAVANGTLALEIALMSLSMPKGSEVIVPSKTYVATASSIVNVNLIPIFADIDLNSQNITVETIKKSYTNRTKAVLCVHLGGYPCELDKIKNFCKRKKIYLIEDCSQAHGAFYKKKSVGSFGDISTWSFCQDKILTTGGEGGMISTNNKKLRNKIWSLKDHGKSFKIFTKKTNKNGFKWMHNSFGTNARLTEMQSALGRYQLNKLDIWVKKRRFNANYLNNIFKKYPKQFTIIKIPKDFYHAMYRYYVFINFAGFKKEWNKNKILDFFIKNKIQCSEGSCSEVYLEKCFSTNSLYREINFQNARSLSKTSLAFSVHPTITKKDLNYTAKIIKRLISFASKNV